MPTHPNPMEIEKQAKALESRASVLEKEMKKLSRGKFKKALQEEIVTVRAVAKKLRDTIKKRQK